MNKMIKEVLKEFNISPKDVDNKETRKEEKRKNKEYKRALKEIRKKYCQPGYKNRRWKKRYAPILKYDWDWDGEYILRLLLYKMELVFTHLTFEGNEDPGSKDPKMKRFAELIDLGYKCLTFDYHEEEDSEFLRDHMTDLVLVYKDGYKKENLVATYRQERKGNWLVTEEDPKFNDWAKEQGIDLKDKSYKLGYSGEWDSEENEAKWHEMINASVEERKSDRREFFAGIADNLDGWYT